MAKPEDAKPARRMMADRPEETRREKPRARKCTFMISELNDVRLSAYARKQGIDRSRVVESALGTLFHGMRIAFPNDQEAKDATAA